MKKLIIILLLSPLAMFGQMGDKTKHMVCGNLISTSVGLTLYKITDKPFLSGLIGFGASILAGHLKEEYDLYNGRVYDKQDLTATIWGGAIGWVIEIPIIDIDRKNRREKELKFTNL